MDATCSNNMKLVSSELKLKKNQEGKTSNAKFPLMDCKKPRHERVKEME